MLKLGRVTKVKVLFLVLVFVFNFDLFKFSAAILEKGLLLPTTAPEFEATNLLVLGPWIPSSLLLPALVVKIGKEDPILNDLKSFQAYLLMEG